jgi:hypothetical protein
MTAMPDPSRRDAPTKPKAYRYAETLSAVEGRIVEALPDIIDRLIARAKDGDVRAAQYLTDRILGRVASLDTPPAEDRRPPCAGNGFGGAGGESEAMKKLRKLFGQSGADEGV